MPGFSHDSGRRRFLRNLAGAAVFPHAVLQEQIGADHLVTREARVRFRKLAVNRRSECEAACAADIDGDGKLDIVCGDTWYQAPQWSPHKFREIGVWGRSPTESGYRDDFADLPIDVNGDGKVDLVSVSWLTGEVSWYENVGPAGGLWPRRVIGRPGNMETAVLAPILGRSALDVLPNCVQQVVWYELRRSGARPDWMEHPVGRQGAGHGIGWGDVNGDGRMDIITPHGWYEQIDARRNRWRWRPEWHCVPDDCGIRMLVLDVDGDGLNDIVFGSGHHYGLYWLQQVRAGGVARWVQRPIDTSWSQAHTLILADIERSGRPVVVTGKRFKAHDTDPGVDDPLGIYYYRYDRRAGHWDKFVIDYGGHAGTGLQLTAIDLRSTGRLDLIAPGKSGVYLFENHGP